MAWATCVLVGLRRAIHSMTSQPRPYVRISIIHSGRIWRASRGVCWAIS